MHFFKDAQLLSVYNNSVYSGQTPTFCPPLPLFVCT